MARKIFVAVAAFAKTFIAGAEIAVKQVYPAHQEAEVPLTDFNVLLEFSESVQTTGRDNSISLSLLSGASAGTVVGIPCGPNVHLSGRYAVVTVSGVILEPGEYSGAIVPTCFSGVRTGDRVTASSWTFRTISRGATVHAFDVTSPRLFTELVSPPSDGWAEPSREVALFFSEAVQPAGGNAAFRFVPADLAIGATPTAEGQEVPVSFDQSSLGKVSLSLGELPAGLEYQLVFPAGVLRDSAGNLLGDSKSLFGAGGYAVRISNQVESFFPANGAVDVSHTSRVVIHFASPVAPGIGSAELCIGKLQSPCSSSVLVSQEDMLYFGNKLILAPPMDLEAGQTYTLSLPSGVVKNFAGMEFNAALSAYNSGMELYSFTVSSTKKAAPELVAARVDCQGGVSATPGLCQPRGGQPAGILDLAGPHVAVGELPVGSQISIFFAQKVQVAAGQAAVLSWEEEGGGSQTVSLAVGAGAAAGVATLVPTLVSGRTYSLRVPHGALTGASDSAGPFAGVTFTFVAAPAEQTHVARRLQAVTAVLSGQSDVEPVCTMKLDFTSTPVVGDSNADRLMTITDSGLGAVVQTIDLHDFDRVAIQGEVMLITPHPVLQGGRSYEVTLEANAVEDLSSAFTFSFSTRPADTVKPSALFFWPPGSKERGKNVVDDNPPYIQFSEAIAAVSGKKITFESGKHVQYTLDAADSVCGTGGSIEDGCVVVNDLDSRVSLYPRGLRADGSGLPEPWSSPGVGYKITVEQGAFKDALSEGAVGNFNDVIEFSDRVSNDNTGPAVVSGDPGSVSEGFALDTASSEVFITFDEIIHAGDGKISIKAATYGGTLPPQLVDSGSQTVGPRGQVVLSFDQAVQAGEGVLEVYPVGEQHPVFVVEAEDAFYVDNKVVLYADLMDQGSYYVWTSSPDAIIGRNGLPMESALNTESSLTYALNSDSEGPKLVWSTADSYNCLPSDGLLPDFELVMNQAMDEVDDSKAVQLYDEAGTLLWSRPLTEVPLVISAENEFEATLMTSSLGATYSGGEDAPLTQGGRYRLRLEAGALERDAVNGQVGLSQALDLTFGICEVRFTTPASKLLRIYSPFSFSKSSETMDSATGGARRFSATMAATSLLDGLGNYLAQETTYDFAHDLTPPALNPSSCNPPAGSYGSPYENIVMAFTETVQAGTGALQLWSRDDTGELGLAFQVDVSSLLAAGVDGHSVMSDNMVSITPKTLCNPAYGSCTDLPEGLYSVRTVDSEGELAAGVFLDVLGNPLPAIDSESGNEWTFTIQRSDARAPEVALDAGSVLMPASGYYPSELRAYVYFTERVQLNPSSPYSSAVFINCGADNDCSTTADNSESLAVLTFGTGAKTTGLDGYGMLRVSRYGMPDNRRYQVVIPTDLVADYSTLGSTRTGPSSNYTFTIEVGTVAALPEETVRPYLVAKEPKNAARRVAVDAPLVLYFNEDIERGTGTVKLCTNSDAQAALGNCNVALLADGSAAEVDMATAIVDRRVVTLSFSANYVHGSTLYVLIPEGIIVDSAGNTNTEIETSMYAFNVLEVDDAAPAIDYTHMPTSASEDIVLHFDEAVTAGTAVSLARQGSVDVPVRTSVSGNTVTISGGLLDDELYILTVPADAFVDIAGNPMAAEQAYSFTVETTPDTAVDPSDDVGPLIGTTTPADGDRSVPPSASIMVDFSEAVQAGTGSITLEASSGSVEVPLSRCYFADVSMVCDPAANLAQYTTYSVSFPAGFVQDAAGNPSTEAGSFSFTTIDRDLTPPLVSATDPVDGTQGVSPGRVLTLSFSEAVQANTGNFLVLDCSPGDPDLCYDGASETTQDTLLREINVDGSTVGTELLFEGSTLYIAQPVLAYDKRYSLQTSAEGVVVDAAGLPLAQMTSGFEFTSERADTTPPEAYVYIPEKGAAAYAAPNSDIVIMFSEPVQVTGSGQSVSISAGAQTIEFGPEDPAAYFNVSGNVLTMRPPTSLPYGSTATLSMPAGLITDYAGNQFAGIWGAELLQWQTPPAAFEELASSGPFAARQGATLQVVQDQLLLFGGRSGSQCFNDVFVSSDGASWTEVAASSPETLPKVDQAATATDASGCMWLLGGQCDGVATSQLWRTCTVGQSWETLANPMSLIEGISWPDSLSGHAIAVLGGWQLLVLDAVRGDFWVFTALDTVARTATDLPFGGRWGPKMFTTSGNDIFVIGGQACSSSSDCVAGGEALMDVWKSPGDSYTMFVGSEWYCQTADYRVGLDSADVASVGARYPGMVLTGDDTLYLIAGQLVDDSASTSAVFTLAPSAPDAVFNAEPDLATYANGVLNLYFDESIELVDAEKVSLLHLGADGALGGTGSDADTYMDYTVSASRQRLVLTSASSTAHLDGLQTYQVVIEDGALADSFGNLISGFPAAYTSDLFIWDRAPQLVSVLPSGEGAAPWTHVALAMSEDAVVGSGSLRLTCAAGQSYSLPVADAVVAGASALFKLPSGSRLTPGQVYTIDIPRGLFRDAAGNKLPANSENTFTVLSGVVSSSSDGYSGSSSPAIDTSSLSASADVEGFPALETVSPPMDATDVPTEGVAVIFTFSEQVVLDTSGTIVEIYDHALDPAVATYTDAQVTSGDISIVENGLKVVMPTLTAAATYTVRLFVGQVVDLAGNAAPAAEATFTCLAGLVDTQPPQLAMTYPSAGSSMQALALETVHYWFLEDIQEGTGDIEITPPSGLQRVVVMPGTSASVEGPQLTVRMLATQTSGGAADSAGNYRIELPAGVVADLDRASEGGGTASGAHELTFGVTSSQAVPDILEFTVAGELPSSSTMVPASAALLLSFDEAVQTGEGSFYLTPQGSGGSGETVSIPATGSHAVFEGSQVWLAPGSDMVPGQQYMLTFDASAVKGLYGASAALPVEGENGWNPYFLVRPPVALERVGSTQFGTDDERHTVSAAVNSDNEIFVVGGADSSGNALGNVWRLQTYRETNCASALMAFPSCSLSLCSGSPATLGTWGVESPAQEMVWRSPSLGGRRCIGSDGVSRGDVGDVVDNLQGTCPCPTCYTAPLDPLPTFMADVAYLNDYVGSVASASTAPLSCAEGYEASPPSGHESADFVCLAANWLSGSWRRPFPECTPHGCELPPPEIAHQDLSTGQPCSSAAPWDPVPHLNECPMKCKAGFVTAFGRENGKFTCNFGEYDPFPSCTPQHCGTLPVVLNGTVTCDVPEGNPIVYGTMCNVVCDPGFHHIGAYTFKCDVQSSLAETPPAYTDVGVCQMATCGELAVTDYDPRGVVLNYTTTHLGVGTKANVWCEEGYRPSDDSFSKFECLVKSNQAGEGVSWVGRLKCVKITCDLGTQQNGYFVCPGSGQYEDTCQLVCIDGYTLSGGDGSFTCGASGQLQGQGYCAPIACPEPSLPENAASTTCSGAMENGTNCSITCASGYTATGDWQCVEGTYVETPACIENGVDAVAQEYIGSALTFEAVLPSGRNISGVLADEAFEDALVDAIADSVVQVQLIELDILELTDMPEGNSAEAAEALAVNPGGRRLQTTGDEATIHVSFRLRAENDTEALALLEDEVSVKARFTSSLETNYEVNVSYVLLDEPSTVIVWQSPVTETFITTVFEADSDPATVILGAFLGVLIGLVIVVGCALRYNSRPEVIAMFKKAASCPRMPRNVFRSRGDAPLLGEASGAPSEGDGGAPVATAPPAGAALPAAGAGRSGQSAPPLAGPPGAGVGVDVGDDRA